MTVNNKLLHLFDLIASKIVLCYLIVTGRSPGDEDDIELGETSCALSDVESEEADDKMQDSGTDESAEDEDMDDESHRVMARIKEGRKRVGAHDTKVTTIMEKEKQDKGEKGSSGDEEGLITETYEFGEDGEVSSDRSLWIPAVRADSAFAKFALQFKVFLGDIMHYLVLPYKLVFHLTVPNMDQPRFKYNFIISFLVCISWIAVITWLMVEFATKTACIISFDEAVLGFTFVAIGTSLPDCLTSIAVAKMGQGNMSVCNALGSNVFDVLFALGFPWLLHSLISGPVQVKNTDITKYTSILTGFLVVLFGVFICFDWKLKKSVGYILLVLYAFFLVYCVVDELTDFPI
eukprot:CAMPEP_0174251280 /NCGR_PEP_ID=MMETSP0439-20130205/1148_1 /TAXON_ID=0 /ORGANISM="Stereomyxa ramosa, Strain Chinc5" /LENGTH=347 /DNA_ID=CAMNT_0015331551 /DNA_START=641 /DNA_END=1684 /DNA_ORIENTATION=+